MMMVMMMGCCQDHSCLVHSVITAFLVVQVLVILALLLLVVPITSCCSFEPSISATSDDGTTVTSTEVVATLALIVSRTEISIVYNNPTF